MTSRGEETREKVTAASVQGVHLIVRNTKNWSNAELKKLTKIVAYDEYVASEGGGTAGNPSGGSSSGDTTQGGGGSQEGDTQEGGGSQEGGGGGTDSGDVGL